MMEALLLKQQQSSVQEEHQEEEEEHRRLREAAAVEGNEKKKRKRKKKKKKNAAENDVETKNEEINEEILTVVEEEKEKVLEADVDQMSHDEIEKIKNNGKSLHAGHYDDQDADSNLLGLGLVNKNDEVVQPLHNTDNDADAQNIHEGHGDKEEQQQAIEPELLFLQKKGTLPRYMQRLHKNHPLASSSNNVISIVHQNSTNAPIHQLYPTTLLLLFLLHLLFFYQWNHRYSKKDVQLSYRQIVRQKRFYKIPLALLSHPPSSSSTSPSASRNSNNARGEHQSSNNGTAIPYGSADHDAPPSTQAARTARSRCRAYIVNLFTHYVTSRLPTMLISCLQYLYNRVWIQRVYPTFISPFLKNGSLSGLPLLTYISHLLWECRALEKVVNSVPLIMTTEEEGEGNGASLDESLTAAAEGNYSLSYLRTIITLALISLSLELYTYHILFKTTSSLSTPNLFTYGATIQLDDFGRPQAINAHRIILDRGICTLTSTAAAILFVYQSYFPHAPFNILPFVSSIYVKDPGFSSVLCMAVLMFLSFRIINLPTMSILYGMSSGGLWALGVTSWLSLDDYWGNGMLGVLLFCIALSLRAAAAASGGSVERRRSRQARITGGGQLSDFIPCIDYVSWDERGRVRRVGHINGDDSDEDSGEDENEDSSSTRRMRQYRDGRNNSNEDSHVGDTNDSGGGFGLGNSISSSSSRQISTSLTSTPRLARRTVSGGSGTAGGGDDDGAGRANGNTNTGDNEQQHQSSPHVLHHRGRVPLMSMDSELDGSTPTSNTGGSGSSSFMNDVGSPSSLSGGGGASDGTVSRRGGAPSSSSPSFRSRRD